MNIAGPQKNSPLIRRGFSFGCRALTEQCAAANIPLRLLDLSEQSTGCEALFSAEGDARKIKRICAEIEDSTPLGRLFDMDVLDGSGRKLDRTELGLEERGCMVCGAPGRGCAARRRHSVYDLQKEINRRLREHFFAADQAAVEKLATQCLIDEVNLTPKPGLVDRANNGSHTDMDLTLFEKSAAALASYWAECFAIGAETAGLPPEDTFARLRPAGQSAEQAMTAVTAGINTHKGVIFLLGTVCGAVGRLWNAARPCRDSAAICSECARMTAAAMAAEWNHLAREGITPTATTGVKLYLQHGLRGARGEISDGLPGVREIALPALRTALAQGCSAQQAASAALLHLIARGTDTNMVKRGGLAGAAWGAAQAANLLQADPIPTAAQISLLDHQFMEKNLSPGGCADLLAVTLFLHGWENFDQ